MTTTYHASGNPDPEADTFELIVRLPSDIMHTDARSLTWRKLTPSETTSHELQQKSSRLFAVESNLTLVMTNG